MATADNDDIKCVRVQHDAGADTRASAINGQARIVKTLNDLREIAGHGPATAMMLAMPADASGPTARASHATLACRPGCAACCTAPSISSAIPGMPLGKPAAVACVQLDRQGRCRLFGQPQRPAVCSALRPSQEMCGDNRAQAMRWLTRLENATAPAPAGAAGGASRGG